MEGQGVTVKGTKEGLMVLVSPEPPLEEVLSSLKEKFSSESSFFQDAELILDLGLRPFQEKEFQTLRALFDASGIRLKGILSDNPITKLMAQEEGIVLLGDRSILSSRVRVSHPVRQLKEEAHRPRPEPERTSARGSSAVFLRKTLRAGQRVHFVGDITILGDVNPGAEVVAGGSIVVFGALRGLAHAGAEGRRDAVVVALELRPTQVRIADCVARPPETAHATQAFPELARIHDNRIVIDRY